MDPQWLFFQQALPPSRALASPAFDYLPPMPPRPDDARAAALGLIKLLRQAGFEAYFAGGCVRDALLGLTPKDYDIATSATPDQAGALLPRCRMVGKAFGVVLSQPARGIGIEVATFRADGAYSDGRRPDSITFTDAKGDAQRRDFTINGLFADPLETNPDGSDRVLDFVGGVADLKAGLIRAIGDPAARFGEDYLRMLRAVRFASRLDFAIEAQTLQALKSHAPKLGGIAKERIGDEVRRALAGPRFVLAARLLEETGLAPHALLLPKAPAFPPLRLERVTQDAAYPTRLAAYALDRGNALDEAAQAQLRLGLNLTNDERDALAALPLLLARAGGWAGLTVAGRKRLLAETPWNQAQMLLSADPATAPLAHRIAADGAALAADGIGISPAPFLNGGALMALGLKPGPAFKELLEQAYDHQLEGALKTPEEAKAWAAKQGKLPVS